MRTVDREVKLSRATMRWTLVLLTLLVSLFVWQSRGTEEPPRAGFRRPLPTQAELPRNNYQILAHYEPTTRLLTLYQEVNITNWELEPWSRLVFHVYPNAFRERETVPEPPGREGSGVPPEFEPSEVRISEVRLNGQEVPYTLEGTILTINLPYLHPRGSQLDVEMDLEITLPVTRTRFGVYEDVALLGNWYPILAVTERGRWRRDPYIGVGEPFYSEVADYLVSIDLPEDYVVGATGTLVQSEIDHGRRLNTYQALAKRDFAWATSSRYKVRSATVAGVHIESYFFGEDRWGELALEIAGQALETFNRLIGPYPYPTFTVVETYLNIFGAMEYPGFIVISDYGRRATDVEESARIERGVVHETAHQWFYAVVGNDQPLEPWVDEALTTYVSMLYFAERYGREEIDRIQHNRAWTPPLPIASSIYDFATWRDYYLTVYLKGSYLLDDLRLRIGDDAFLQTLQFFYRDNAFRIAQSEDFYAAIAEAAGIEHARWFRGQVTGAR